MSSLSTKRENGRRRPPSVDGRSQHGSEIDASWSSAASSSYDFAKGSSYPDRPRDSPDRRKLSSLGSVRLVAGAFTSCFSPLRRTREQEEQGLSETVVSTVSSESSMGSKASSGRQFKMPRQEDCRAFGMLKLSYAEIARATNNFSAENEIGRGGFGVVYRGRLRDGTFVAVKRAKKGLHDYHLSAEFESEIKTLSMVEHLNLVRFFGCLESPDEWIIVVEYVHNGTLRDHLHEHPIIHRDIKPANILLTDKLRAKVADFGFARLTSDDPTATHVSTQIKGTAGRMDPEYLSTMQLTEKSDVYSFGVLLVELMTGRCPIERGRGAKERVTVTWVMKKLRDGEAASLIDPRLTRNQAADLAVENVLTLASQCLLPTRREERPSMKECAEVLWGIRKIYRDAHHV
ncbi:calmodulin-binding receptor-like cytoplasmic kinase 2 isoform X2 [Nymphaea colorata]|uniref:calmodulin-binding receptor-like cytoplasmic kinase 2 isoform X2 n=1 Tax=Nymphaea colorata TaxID=210225 RepID=UPI00129D3A38|nr:calmodulin-binding receptor-like cytoplasmic kinase 2 isoform X2 [Nymphaea colorata]